MGMLPVLPKEAMEIIQAVASAGGQAYVVGGALRNILLGKTPEDWDFAATLPTEQLLEIFEKAVLIGGVCGTVQAPMGNTTCEITPCRTEGKYTDKRHPDYVQFVPDIFQDLARRDFTVNAMAYNGEVLLDPYGGQRDLTARVLRCVGQPEKRFEEDPLRILRMFRFSATLGFQAEWATFCAANEQMESIATLSRERIRGEVERMIISPGAQVLSPLIAKGGLRTMGFTFAPALSALAQVPALGLYRWWALIALCGANIQQVGEGFGFSRQFIGQLYEMDRLYKQGPAKDKIRLKMNIRNTKLDYWQVASTFAAVTPAFGTDAVFFTEVKNKKEPYRVQDLAVDGEMLKLEGISGVRCGKTLEALLNIVIKNPAFNEAGLLLKFAKELQQVI